MKMNGKNGKVRRDLGKRTLRANKPFARFIQKELAGKKYLPLLSFLNPLFTKRIPVGVLVDVDFFK